MSTTTMPNVTSQTAGAVVLYDISWEFYERFLEELDEQRLPHSYVNGDLTLMSPSARHEGPKKWIAQLVEALTDELGSPRRSLGAQTLKSVFGKKGAEPDEGYLLANAPLLAGRRDYDPQSDPPPDLLIEIDISSPSLNRLPIYAEIGVPEVWVYDGKTLSVRLLSEDGSYAESESSKAFPFLPMQAFSAWIEKAYETDETAWIRSFREWVRKELRSDD